MVKEAAGHGDQVEYATCGACGATAPLEPDLVSMLARRANSDSA